MSQHMEFHRSFVRLSDVISAIRHAEYCDKNSMDMETDFPLNLNFQIYLSDSGLALLDCGTYELISRFFACRWPKTEYWSNGSSYFFAFPFPCPMYVTEPGYEFFWRCDSYVCP